MKIIEELTHCVACGSDDFISTMNLGTQPLANSLKKDHDEFAVEFPLGIKTCKHCFHTQLTYAVNPKLMFHEYPYVSGTSRTMHDYMKSFAEKAKASYWSGLVKIVVDIGCNDGTQLDYFRGSGWSTMGVEPSENLAKIADSKGHYVVNEFFDENTFSNDFKADFIIAQNVFAHTAKPLEFLLNAKKIMHDKSILYIQTSQANMIKNGEFDTIYHEHISFFNLNSMMMLLKRAGLFLHNVWIAPVHGDSYVFMIKKHNDPKSLYITDRFHQEISDGLYSYDTYENFYKKANDAIVEIENLLNFSKGRVFGYGAPAKGMTLLNMLKYDAASKFEFIVDDNPLKQGKFATSLNIPIIASEKLNLFKTDITIVPLAWNFFDEIYEKCKVLRPDNNDTFLKIDFGNGSKFIDKTV